MNRKEAKEILLKEGRFTCKPEYAKEISKAFGLELNEKLIRTSKGYRENVFGEAEKVPRVTISSLSEDICKRIGKKPDPDKLDHANSMNGEGSWHDLYSEAHAMVL